MAKNQSSNPTAKKKSSALEKELLRHVKKGQPVLLYGNDTLRGRVNLIKKIHLLNGGIDASWEYIEGKANSSTEPWEDVDDWGYVDDKEGHLSEEDMQDKILKAKKDGFGLQKIKDNWKNTHKTWKYVNCACKNGKGIIETLTYGYRYLPFSRKQIHLESIDIIDFPEMENYFNWYPDIMRNGLLFIDNLHFESGDDEDKYYYEKLTSIIETRRNNNPDSWLIAYTYNPKGFPSQFREQFVEILLDDSEEKPVSVEIERDYNLLKYKNEKEKLIPIQIDLLELLYENKDNLVTRNTILDNIWKGRAVYEKQITDHISKIKKAFIGLGVDKKTVETEIIKTVKKSRVSEGGYIFNSNIIILYFH